MSKLLIYDNPIMILPKLAQKIGLNEAVMLQQIHYWLVSSQHEKEGRKWVYNTYKDWQLQLPFWSERTIKRSIKSLEDQGYLLSANYNRLKMDKTKWYSINYEKLAELESDARSFLESSTGQIGTIAVPDCPIEEDSMTQAIPEITTETYNKDYNKESYPFFRNHYILEHQKSFIL